MTMEIPVKEISNDMHGKKYDYINLSPADNGWILRYDCVREAATKSESYYEDKTEVFSVEETKAAFDKLKSLHLENLIYMVEKEKDGEKKAKMMAALTSDDD